MNSKKTIDGVIHYKTGTYIDNVYRCDQLGNATEMINGSPRYYRLYEYEIAVTTDAFGNPSDFVSFGYDIETK